MPLGAIFGESPRRVAGPDDFLWPATMLRRAVHAYINHYHRGEENHQGLDNRLIEPGKEWASSG